MVLTPVSLRYTEDGGFDFSSWFGSRVTQEDIDGLTKFGEAFKKSSNYAQSFDLTLQNASRRAKELAPSIANGTKSVDTLSVGMSVATVKTKLLGVAAKATGIALNMALTLGISFAIQGIVRGIQYLIETEQDAIDKANELIGTYKEAQTSYQSNISTLKGLKSQFDELSKGVDENGNKVNLTAEEYDTYLSLIKQITTISPDLVLGYDNEKNAILNYKSALDDAISSQEAYIKNQRNIYLGGGEDIFEGKKNEWKSAAKELGKAGEDLGNSVYDGFWDTLTNLDGAQKKSDAFASAMKQVKIDWQPGIDTWGDSPDKLMAMYENYEEIFTLLKGSNAYDDSELAELESKVLSLAGAYTKLKSIEQEQANYLSEWSKDQSWYNDIPIGALDEFAQGLTNIVDPLSGMNDNIVLAAQYSKEFTDVLQGDGVQGIVAMSKGLADGSVSIDEYEAAIESLNESWEGDPAVRDALISYLQSFASGLGDVEGQSESATRSTEDFADAVDKLLTTTKAIDSSMSTLNKAFIEQKANGKLSASAILDVVEAGYAAALSIDQTTGAVTLNSDAFLALAKAKLEDHMAELKIMKSDLQTKINGDKTAASGAAQSLLALANSKAANEMVDLTLTKNDIKTKLIEDGKAAVNSAGDFIVLAAAKKAANDADIDLLTEIEAQMLATQEAINELGNVINGVGSSSGSSADAWKEAFEKAYSELQYLRDTEQRSNQEYYDSLSNLDREYFAGKDKYIDEHRKNLKELRALEKEIFDDYMNDIEHQISLLSRQEGTEQKQIDMYRQLQEKLHAQAEKYRALGIDENNDLIQTLQTQWWSYEDKVVAVYEAIKQKAIEVAQAQVDAQQKVVDSYSDALSVAAYVIDEQIKGVEKLNDALQDELDLLEEQKSNWETSISYATDVIDERISLLEDEKKALQDVNDEKDRQLALEAAERNHSIRIFRDGEGFVYEQDTEAIRKAQLDIDLAEIDQQIEAWQAEKEMWTSVVDNYKKEQDRLIALEMFGYDISSDILNMKSKDLAAFVAKQYSSVNQQIANTNREIQSNNEKIASWQLQKAEWTSVAENYEMQQKRMEVALEFGADFEKQVLSGRLDFVKAFVTQYNEEMDKLKAAQTNLSNAQSSSGSSTSSSAYDKNVDYAEKILGSSSSSEAQYWSELRDAKIAGEGITGVQSTEEIRKLAGYKNGGAVD